MLTSEEKALLQRHVAIDGDGNVVGNDNTVQVTKVDAETYVAEINDRRIKFTFEQLVNIQESQVGVVGNHTTVHGGMYFYQQAPYQHEEDAQLKHPDIYHNLPQPDYGEFVGRKEELAQVHHILRPYPHSRHAVVTIDGIGGIGKSALALEVAHRYLRDYDHLPKEECFNAIIWTSAKASVLTADGIAPRQQITRTLDDIYTAIAVTLEREAITRARPEEQDALVTKALTQQRTLLIVDNLETVDDERVNAFLRELPAPTKAIVTTRHRVNVAYPIRLSGMSEEEGLDLIWQECKKKGVTLTDVEAEKLYNRTGGVPLAVMWSVAQIGYGYVVGSVLQRLSEPTGDIARFCFDGALERIRDKPSHKLLMALSIFVPDANRQALGYVGNLPKLDRDDGLVELQRLSLINKHANRFKMLPLTKSFAIAEMESYPKFKSKVSKRRVDYLKSLCGVAESEYYWRFGDKSFHEEKDNILDAIEWSYEHGTAEDIFSLTLAAENLLDTTGEWQRIMVLCHRALDLARSLQKPTAIARFVISEGWILRQRGEYEEAEDRFLEGLKQYRSVDNQEGISIALHHLSAIYRKREEFQRARETSDQAWSIAEELGLSDLQALTNTERGKLARDTGQWNLAYQYFLEVRDWFQKRAEQTPRDEMLARSIWGHLAAVDLQLGNHRHAKQLCVQSLDYFADHSSKSFFATLQYRLSLAEEGLGELNEAFEHAQKAVDWFDRLGMQPDLVEAQALLDRLIDKKD